MPQELQVGHGCRGNCTTVFLLESVLGSLNCCFTLSMTVFMKALTLAIISALVLATRVLVEHHVTDQVLDPVSQTLFQPLRRLSNG